MAKAKKKTALGKLWDRKLAFIVILAAALFFFFGVSQVLSLQKAHSTFDDYYKFRGCTELLGKTADSGFCRVANGHVIKIVKYQGKWYLDGDLPCGFLCW